MINIKGFGRVALLAFFTVFTSLSLLLATAFPWPGAFVSADNTTDITDDLVDFSKIYQSSGTSNLQCVTLNASDMPSGDLTGLVKLNNNAERFITYMASGNLVVTAEYVNYGGDVNYAKNKLKVFSSPDNIIYTEVSCTSNFLSSNPNGWNRMNIISNSTPNGTQYVKIDYDITSAAWTPIITNVHIIAATPEAVPFTIPSYYGNNMIFQQEKPINISGTAETGTQVSVVQKKSSDGTVIATGTSLSGTDGKWIISLPAMLASFEKYVIDITHGGVTLSISNVLIGEIWVSGGQSNMELQTQYCTQRLELLSGASNPNIRIFTQSTAPLGTDGLYSYTPVSDIKDGKWATGDSANNVAECSAVAYTFAKKLYSDLNVNGKSVPVGIINTAMGATSIEAWIGREKIESTPTLKNEMLKYYNMYVSTSDWNTRTDPSLRYNQMSALYNHKIAPFMNFNIKGIIWYQGENNVGASTYMRYAIKSLAENWSSVFGSPGERLPFVFTQLAPYYYTWLQTTGYNNTVLAATNEGFKDAYLDMKAINDNTALISTNDIDLNWKDTGNPFQYQHPIHPLSKKPVGERMAGAAQKVAYGKNTVVMGPVFKSMTINGNKAIIKFDNYGSGLNIKDNNPAIRGFSIAGANLKYIEANALITASDTIEVWNNSILTPTAVTYAFYTMSNYANLMNSENLPAMPFRTDTTPRKSSISSVDGALYAMPYPWMWADTLKFWSYTSSDYADMNDVWTKAPIFAKGSVEFLQDTTNKSEGLGSLKVNYVTTAKGAAGFGPETKYPSLLTQNTDYEQYLNLAAYDKISIDIKNSDNREKLFQILIKDEAGNLACLGYGNTSAAKISPNSNFTTYKFDLKTLFKIDGITKMTNTSILSTAKKLQFVLSDSNNATGSLNIDNVRFEFGNYTNPTNGGIPQNIDADLFDDLTDISNTFATSGNTTLNSWTGDTINFPSGDITGYLKANNDAERYIIYKTNGCVQVTAEYLINSGDENFAKNKVELYYSSDNITYKKVTCESNLINQHVNGWKRMNIISNPLPENVQYVKLLLDRSAQIWEPIIVNVSILSSQLPILSFNNFKVSVDNLISRIPVGISPATFLSDAYTLNDYTIALLRNGTALGANDKVGTGVTVRVNTGNGAVDYTVILKGDVNGDGDININDLAAIKMHLLKSNELTGVYKNAGAISGNINGITISDLLATKKHLLNISLINQG